jgi:acetyltransferase
MFAKAPIPRGSRVGVVSESGGMASFMADKCGEVGLDVPPLSAATKEKLIAIMGERGSAANPADLTLFGLSDTDLPRIIDHLLQEDQQDLLIMSSIGGDVQARAIVNAALRAEKPILFSWGGSSERVGLEELRQSNVPLFFLPGKVARAAKRLVKYHERRRALLADEPREYELHWESDQQQRLNEVLAGAAGAALTESESKVALSLFGIASPAEALCLSSHEAVRAAESIGYPVALKVVSRQIAHKTEAGGVKLGISDPRALADAWDETSASVRAYAPEADVEGMLVQQMVSHGLELIVGISCDVQFGPVLMLGMGGVFAELVGSAAWRLCPVNRREARDMIAEIRGLPQILGGYRGGAPLDADALVAALVNVSKLAVLTKGCITSLDVNPLVVLPQGDGVVALDALIVPGAGEASLHDRAGHARAVPQLSADVPG